VPSFARWSGRFAAGKTLNGIVSHQDWLPTLLAAAGVPDVKDRLLQGHQAGDRTYKVHIDGHNMLAYLQGETDECPRNAFFYVNDDGALVALRVGDWKVVFAEQRAKTMQLWAEPFVTLRLPELFNLRRDPFERADENSNTYWDWMLNHAYVAYIAQRVVANEIQSFVEFPPRQEPASFNLEDVLATLEDATGGAMH
jgi:arylsulfatase A-like enzyme